MTNVHVDCAIVFRGINPSKRNVSRNLQIPETRMTWTSCTFRVIEKNVGGNTLIISLHFQNELCHKTPCCRSLLAATYTVWKPMGT